MNDYTNDPLVKLIADALVPLIVANMRNAIREEFISISHTIKGEIHEEQIFNVDEAANFLGLAKSSIYCNPTIPVMKRGKRNYYSKIDLIAWLKAGKRKSSDEIDTDVDRFIKSMSTKKRNKVVKNKKAKLSLANNLK